MTDTDTATAQRERVHRGVRNALAREAERRATSFRELAITGAGIADRTSTRTRGITLTWSEQAREALPKRGDQ